METVEALQYKVVIEAIWIILGWVVAGVVAAGGFMAWFVKFRRDALELKEISGKIKRTEKEHQDEKKDLTHFYSTLLEKQLVSSLQQSEKNVEIMKNIKEGFLKANNDLLDKTNETIKYNHDMANSMQDNMEKILNEQILINREQQTMRNDITDIKNRLCKLDDRIHEAVVSG
jgi:hypothetical protein